MADISIETLANPRIPLVNLTVARPTQAEPEVKDAVVLTPEQLLREAAVLKAEGQAELTRAVQLEREADVQQCQAVKHRRESEVQEFEAKKAERAAAEAAEEAAAARAEEARAEEEARQTRWEADAKKALADQQEQQAQLLKTQGECLLASHELEEFNQGVFLLSMADSGFESAETLRDEAVHLSSNVQASLELAKASQTRAQQKTEEARQGRASVTESQNRAEQEVQLSGRARQAADALKLDAADRRRIAEELLAEADVTQELGEMGARLQGGFLLH